MKRQTIIFWIGVVLLLGTMLFLQITSVRNESQTVDEGAHLAAGYSYWKTGDFRMNPEHPPLVKLFASVPLLFVPLHLPTDHPSWEERNQWEFAHQLLYHNTIDGDTLIFLGRLPIMLLGLLLGLCIALWSRHLWGIPGALLSLTLYVFDPTVLAHSRYVTTDIGVALFFFATFYFFDRYCERPTIRRWWLVAFAFALAHIAKFSAVLLWVFLPLLWLLRRYHGEDRDRFGWRRALPFFLSLLVITNVIIVCVYGFELKPPLADPQFAEIYRTKEIWAPSVANEQPPLAHFFLRITDPTTTFGSLLRTGFATIPLPAYTYFRGLSQVVWHNYWGHSSYLLGDYRSTGWWYYFPVAFLVKTPLTTIILLFCAFLYISRLYFLRFASQRIHFPQTRHRLSLFLRTVDFSYLLLLAPPLIYFFTSITSKINLGVRHLLPVYPFLFVFCGILATIRFKHIQRYWRLLISGFVVVYLCSSALAYPHYLSYFSELVGGSKNGTKYLVDSNLDWGQELKRLGQYCKIHNIPFVYITYFGQAPLERYIRDFRYLPKTNEKERIANLDGWAAISATALMNESGDYFWLRSFHPTATIGDAIFLYDLRKKHR